MRSNHPPRSYALEYYVAGMASALALFIFGYQFAQGAELLARIARFGL